MREAVFKLSSILAMPVDLRVVFYSRPCSASENFRTNNDNNDYNGKVPFFHHFSIVMVIVPLLLGDDSSGLDGPPGPTSRPLLSSLLAKELQ